MSLKTQFEFSSNKKITCQKADNINNFLWIAFEQNADGICIIKKSAIFYPTQTYYTLEKEVTNINALDLDANNLYVAFEDSVLLGQIISKNNPLTSIININKGAIVESPIDVAVNSSDLWFLLPGIMSGENAKLLRYNLSGVLQQTVDLQKSGNIVNNAKTMTVDGNNDIWIGVYESPTKIVRVFDTGGSVYDFTIFDDFLA